MKFSLNGNLYETMYRRRHRITCCNKQIIPMMSFMKAQNLYLENKYKEEKMKEEQKDVTCKFCNSQNMQKINTRI